MKLHGAQAAVELRGYWRPDGKVLVHLFRGGQHEGGFVEQHAQRVATALVFFYALVPPAAPPASAPDEGATTYVTKLLHAKHLVLMRADGSFAALH